MPTRSVRQIQLEGVGKVEDNEGSVGSGVGSVGSGGANWRREGTETRAEVELRIVRLRMLGVVSW